MTPFKLVVKHKPIVKKNTMHTTWYRESKGKDGVIRKTPLKFPIKYYTKAYIEWAKKAVEQQLIYKQTHFENHFPISDQVAVTIIFYLDYDGVVDLTNLAEGIMDSMTGKSGLNTNKKMKHEDYQLLKDDSQKYVKFNSMVAFYDKLNPRIEVFVSPYNLKMVGALLTIIHPGMTVTLGDEEQTLFDEAFPNGFLKDKRWSTE